MSFLLEEKLGKDLSLYIKEFSRSKKNTDYKFFFDSSFRIIPHLTQLSTTANEHNLINNL